MRHVPKSDQLVQIFRPGGYKTFFMLKSTEHGIQKAHKKQNTEK